ncbi:short-chain dehydrogenase [Pseudomassariella vexata]|uniref:Short-chain dehydrogenase n=1 Tax=Pseudomassariella vexata TaxID=1141098 RepID=A0A1Y2EJL8_9PEZI|nr:short-chain dehydrogenase [Pseudomassariella vexata]ORY71740.1 short-chain dehydrogenase [Pseudomassariella vexata]
MSLEGKVIALTGAASGIGLATAQILSRKRATVCIADVSPNALQKAEEAFSALKVPFSVTKVDVSKRDEVDSWIDGIVQKYGKIDGAANCAGIIGKHHGLRAVADLEDDEWHKIMAVNLTGTMYCLRAELRKIVDGGSIVNISSIQGIQGFANHGAYSASKHAVIGLTKSAAKENGKRQVRVNAVAPGAIYTPLMEKAWQLHDRPTGAPFDDGAALGRQGTAEECANVIVFLLSPESKYVSGSVYSVDGAW